MNETRQEILKLLTECTKVYRSTNILRLISCILDDCGCTENIEMHEVSDATFLKALKNEIHIIMHG